MTAGKRAMSAPCLQALFEIKACGDLTRNSFPISIQKRLEGDGLVEKFQRPSPHAKAIPSARAQKALACYRLSAAGEALVAEKIAAAQRAKDARNAKFNPSSSRK